MVELDISVCSIDWKENERGVLEEVASKIDDGEILFIVALKSSVVRVCMVGMGSYGCGELWEMDF